MMGGSIEGLERSYLTWDRRICSPLKTEFDQPEDSFPDQKIVLTSRSTSSAIEKFVKSYQNKSTQPIFVVTKNGIVECRQPLKVANAKAQVLKRWLDGGTRSAGFAMGLISEIFAKDILTESLSVTGKSGLRVFYAPDQLDKSITEGREADKRVIQKGGDLVIGKQDNVYLHPFAIVDVTLNRTKGLGSANGKSAGISPSVELPVVVLGLGDYVFKVNGKEVSPKDYLRDIMRPAIQKGEYRPFYGLDKDSLKQILAGVTERLAFCCQSFDNFFERFPDQEVDQQVILDRLRFLGTILQSPTSDKVAV